MKINWISRQSLLNYYLDKLNEGLELEEEIKRMLSEITK